MVATLVWVKIRLGIALALALAACSPPPVLPDRAESDASVEDVSTFDGRSNEDGAVGEAGGSDSAADAVQRDGSGSDGCVDYYMVYADNDGDGFGVRPAVLVRCGEPMNAGAVLREGDCDDTNARIFPGATETCDGVDSNCDGDPDRTAPMMPLQLPRDQVHVSCADTGRALGIWRFNEWPTEPRCAFRGLASPAPYRALGSTACQVCRADTCLCWTDPVGGGGRSIACPYDG